jgi:2-polyprenyl-6-methoxyphenol hydroxylase-like FAD-dependent oxidoreductase
MYTHQYPAAEVILHGAAVRYDGSPALTLLSSWGWSELDVPVVTDNATGVVTIQCHLLERMLALVLATAGVRLEYGRSFQRMEHRAGPQGTSTWVAIFEPNIVTKAGSVEAAAELVLPFQLLIGADGRHSAVRHAIGSVQLQPLERLPLGPYLR